MLKKILIFSVLCQSLLLAASSISIFPADFQNGNYAVNADNVVFLKFKFAANGNAMLTAGKTQLVIELDDSVKVVAAASEHPVKTMPLAISSGNGKAVIDLPPSYVREMIREKSVPWGAGLLIGFQASKTAVGKRFPVQFELKGGEKVFASKILKLAVHKPLPPVKQLQQLLVHGVDFGANLRKFHDFPPIINPAVQRR